jgi:hypothetical protein
LHARQRGQKTNTEVFVSCVPDEYHDAKRINIGKRTTIGVSFGLVVILFVATTNNNNII